jgi:predicted negative regulator of RcsB-dependent stress response
LHSALGQREGVIATSDAPRPVEDRSVARELAAALDRATSLGQWELAERIATQSDRIAREHPVLAERLARLRVARSEFEAALNIIDACHTQPASLRLLRTVCLLQLGRAHEAHADLLGWARKSSAPLQARLMLALLEWETGHHDDAVAALQHNLKQIEDPHTLAALTLMAASQNRTHMASIWAERLRTVCVALEQRPYFETLLQAAGFARPRHRIAATPENAAALGTELLAQEHLIPVLVEAQRLAPHQTAEADTETARLLASAIANVVDEFEDTRTACASLVELHERLGEDDIAEAWRGRMHAARRDDVIASIGGRGRTSVASPFGASLWQEKAA